MSETNSLKIERNVTPPPAEPTHHDLDRDSGPSVINVLGSAVRTALSFLPGGGLLRALGGQSTDLEDMYKRQEELLQQQMELQMMSQEYSALSNMLKVDHETRMNTIRNIK